MHDGLYHLWIDCDILINLINWLIDKICVTLGDVCFKQVVGIPMGTDCAPFFQQIYFVISMSLKVLTIKLN